jgi:hypothetical protein
LRILLKDIVAVEPIVLVKTAVRIDELSVQLLELNPFNKHYEFPGVIV